MAQRKQMQAWLYTSASQGLEKSIHLGTRDIPKPKRDEYLIQVLARSLNPGEIKVAEANDRLAALMNRLFVTKPASPGFDFCGELIGENRLVFGKVSGHNTYGTWGQYIVAGKADFIDVPAGLDVTSAAALGVAGLSAYQAIVPFVKKGNRVFINGGSGGVGTMAIQIAKIQGCHVTTSCSGKNVELCKSLGADDVVDYTQTDLASELARGPLFDLVVDAMGYDENLHKKSERFLKPTGLFILVAIMDSTSSGMWSMLSSWLQPTWLGGPKRRWKLVFCQNHAEHLGDIARWAAAGELKVVVDEVFEYGDVPKAIEKVKTGRTRGKVLVKGPAGPSGMI